jgi:hypothetical protein
MAAARRIVTIVMIVPTAPDYPPPRWRTRMPINSAHPRYPLSRAAASIVLLATVSCAQLPTTASVAIPPVPPQQAGVSFYRVIDPSDQNTTTPYVRLNGAIAGVPEHGAPSTRMSRPDAIRSRSTARA